MTGSIPTLMSHLYNEFSLSGEKLTAVGFVNFCERYLDANRPVENWPADSNVGIRLSNNVRVLLCKSLENVRGSMQDSGAISVTNGQSQPGQEGVVQINSPKII